MPSESTHESMKEYKPLKAYEFFAGMYMTFFTTKLTRTTTFASLNQRYCNLLYETIYQSCIFQGYGCQSLSYSDIIVQFHAIFTECT